MKSNRDYKLEERLERENQDKINALHTQVQEIRNAATMINEESKSSNTFLGSFSRTMDRGLSGMNSTMNRFDQMLNEKHNRVALYVMGTLTLLFIVTWKFMISNSLAEV